MEDGRGGRGNPDSTSNALTVPKATVGYQSAPHIQAVSFMRHH
jgi:hypothetical protein